MTNKRTSFGRRAGMALTVTLGALGATGCEEFEKSGPACQLTTIAESLAPGETTNYHTGNAAFSFFNSGLVVALDADPNGEFEYPISPAMDYQYHTFRTADGRDVQFHLKPLVKQSVAITACE